jgi:hypothetical protein
MNEYSLSGLLQGGTLSSGVYTLTIRGDRAEEQVRVVVE